jgi:hypothetical protein
MWIWLMALIAVSLCITMLILEMILNPEIKPVPRLRTQTDGKIPACSHCCSEFEHLRLRHEFGLHTLATSINRELPTEKSIQALSHFQQPQGEKLMSLNFGLTMELHMMSIILLEIPSG